MKYVIGVVLVCISTLSIACMKPFEDDNIEKWKQYAQCLEYEKAFEVAHPETNRENRRLKRELEVIQEDYDACRRAQLYGK